MARDDTEFPAWLAARWPHLVRSLVLLGHPRRDAERIGLDALADLLPGWRRLHHEGDVDVELYREVLVRRRRWKPRTEVPVDDLLTVPPGLAEPVGGPDETVAALASLSPEDRTVVVLLEVAELSADQVDEVVGETRRRPTYPSGADVRLAAESVQVTALNPADVRERVRAGRRRVWRRVAVAGAALVLLAAAAVWWDGRSDDTAEVRRAANPLPVAWYADGTLHLAEVTVRLPGVRRLASVPDGVVLSDRDGRVLHVAADGRQERLGDTVPGSPLAVEADSGWVGWADPGTGDPELVVHDTAAGEEVGRRSLSVPGAGNAQPVGDNQPIAIDGERVFYVADGTTYAWDPLEGGSAFAVAGSLVDAADGARLTRHPEGLSLQGGAFRGGTVVPAVSGSLTRDGRFAFTRDQFSEMVVRDVGNGRPLDRMYSPSDEAVSWGYVDDGSFLFVVLHKLQDKTYQDTLQMPSEGDYRIYHCDPLRADQCVKLAEVDGDVPDVPIIAR